MGGLGVCLRDSGHHPLGGGFTDQLLVRGDRAVADHVGKHPRDEALVGGHLMGAAGKTGRDEESPLPRFAGAEDPMTSEAMDVGVRRVDNQLVAKDRNLTVQRSLRGEDASVLDLQPGVRPFVGVVLFGGKDDDGFISVRVLDLLPLRFASALALGVSAHVNDAGGDGGAVSIRQRLVVRRAFRRGLG